MERTAHIIHFYLYVDFKGVLRFNFQLQDKRKINNTLIKPYFVLIKKVARWRS